MGKSKATTLKRKASTTMVPTTIEPTSSPTSSTIPTVGASNSVQAKESMELIDSIDSNRQSAVQSVDLPSIPHVVVRNFITLNSETIGGDAALIQNVSVEVNLEYNDSHIYDYYDIRV